MPISKTIFRLVFLAALVGAGDGSRADILRRPALDTGGVTYDFGAISEKFAAARAKPSRERILIRNAIPDALDGVFALSEGQVGVYVFEWRGNDATRWEAEKIRINVRLPRAVGLVDCNFAPLAEAGRTTLKNGDVVWSLEIRHGMGRFMPDVPATNRFQRAAPFQLLLAAGAGCGPAGEGAIAVSYDGTRVSNVERVRFEVIPRIAVRAPRRLWSGVFTGQCLFDFREAGAFERLASFMTDAGMRWIIWPKWQSPKGCDERALPVLRKAGFTYLMPHDCSLCDGYQVGPGYVRPANERFVTEAKGVWYDGAICPIAVYRQMPYFMGYATNGLPAILKGADGAWANWEPHPAGGKGCFCDKCRAAFAEYSGLPADVVAAAWPQEMKKGGRYAEPYIKFRAAEFAKVVKTVDKWVRRYTGGEKSLGFNPGVAWCEMGRKWRSDIDACTGYRYAREVSTREYAGSLKWIQPWGPYARWETRKPYVYSKERYLNYFVAAKDVSEQLERDYGKASKPNLMALPSGMQDDVWVSQPEELAMAFDAFYFNGWRAVAPYSFPRGYDARYWRAIAGATERAAKYEDWILDGVRVDGAVTATTVPEFATPCALVTVYVPAATNVPLLRTAAFRLNGTTAVAVFNYWLKGAAFFDLRVDGLEDGLYEVVDENGVRFAKSASCAVWTARELKTSGVRLMTGAVRTRVFEIRPKGASGRRDVRQTVLPRQLDELFEALRPKLKEEAEKDAAIERDRRRRKWIPEAI